MREQTIARARILEGDLLLFRKKGLLAWITARGGRSIYSHVGMAGKMGGRVMCLQTIHRRGAEAVLLKNLVKKRQIDLFRVMDDFNRRRAVREMIELTGKPYGVRAVLRVALRKFPFIRWFVRPDMNDESNGDLPFCSHAVARAYCRAGLDPVPQLANRLTEPADLARSACFKYQSTLVEDYS